MGREVGVILFLADRTPPFLRGVEMGPAPRGQAGIPGKVCRGPSGGGDREGPILGKRREGSR